MANLSAKELLKYSWRQDLFIKKLEQNILFELNDGLKVNLTANDHHIGILTSCNLEKLKSLRFESSSGNIIKLTDLKKTSEFGGKSEGASVAKENFALNSLKEQILTHKTSEALPITIDGIVYDVFDVVSTPGTPKSDFHLTSKDGSEIAWISHKDGTLPTHFQQWGGTSARIEPFIASHKETQDFVYDLKIQNPHPSYFRRIQDEEVRMISVYGNEFGANLSRQNVSLVLQGNINLEKSGNTYLISSTHTHVNGDKIEDDYEPVYMTRKSSDRSDHGVPNTRIFISPIKSRPSKEI